MTVKPLLLTVLLGCALMAAPMSMATTLEKLAFKDLVQDASACVVAETQSVEYAMDNGAPITITTFKVTKTAFGATPETIKVISEGGHLSNRKVSMGEVNAGAPVFLNGTSNVLLLDELGAGNYQVTGYSQGVFGAYMQEGQMLVRLPQSQGGATPLDEALETINNARTETRQQIQE